MRTLTSDQLALLNSSVYQPSLRVLVADADDVMRDYSDQADYNWIDSVEIDTQVDQPVSQSTIRLRRDIIDGSGDVLSLSPLRSDSILNRNAATAFAPAIDVGRDMQILAATTQVGVAADTEDWQNLAEGPLDDWDIAKTPIVSTARDGCGVLVDLFIEEETTYGSDAGTPMEDVFQAILDDWGPSGMTLYCPVSPGFAVKPTKVPVGPVMDALQTIAGWIGWNFGSKWDNDTAAWRPTLFSVDRDKTTPDRVISASQYFDVQTLKVNKTDIRNAIDLSYRDAATGVRTILPVEDAASIAKYKVRNWMQVVEPDDSPIDSEEEATVFINAMLADLKDPLADQTIEMRFDWSIEVGDLLRFTANGVHYDTDQDLAVVAVKHSLSANKHRTIVQVRGRPCGRYLGWLARASIPASDPILPTLDNFRVVSADDANDTFGWTKGVSTAEVWAAAVTFTAPLPDDPWSIVRSAVMPLDTDTFAVPMPPPGSYTLAQIEPRSSALLAGAVQRVFVAPGQPPINFGASPQGTGAVDSNGRFTPSVDGTQQCVSYKWLVGTIDFPSDADVIASGAIVNGRQFDLPNVLTLDFGQTGYLTAVPYSGLDATGTAGPSVRVRGSYTTYTPTKTVAYSVGSMTPIEGWIRPYGNYFGPSVQSAIATPIQYTAQAVVLIPVGATLIKFEQDIYYNDPGGAGEEVSEVTITAWRVDEPGAGGNHILGFDTATNLLGWQLPSVILSDLSTGKPYLLWAGFTLTVAGTTSIHDITTAYGGSFYVTYQMGNPSTTI